MVDDLDQTQETSRRLMAAMNAMATDIQDGSKRIKDYMDANGYGADRIEKVLDTIGPDARPAMASANARYLQAAMAATHAFERAVAESLGITHKSKKSKAQKLKI